MGEGKTTAGAARERSEALLEVLAERILVLDGATGTWIQGQNLTAADFRRRGLRGMQRAPRPDAPRRRAPDARELPRGGRLGELYVDQEAWSRKAVLSIATSRTFSSDRTIAEYASEIWHVDPCPAE
jgi:Carbohydrate phosphorylase